MSTSQPHDRRRHIALALVLALGFTLRLGIAWADTATLVTRVLPDDAFYYFRIADNIMAGRGVTFDGVSPTNGFHPLWALLLMPIFGLIPSATGSIHVALVISSLFDTGTAYLAYRSARRLSDHAAAGPVAAALYALNPYILYESLNGLETAVSTFLFAATAYVYVFRLRPREGSRVPPSWRAYAGLGAIAGTMVLGRTDSILFLPLIGLDQLWRRSGRAILPLVAIGIPFMVVLAPWLVWNWATFGSPIQVSGLAVPHVARTHLFDLSGLTGPLRIVGPVLYLASTLFRMVLPYVLLPALVLVAHFFWRAIRRSNPDPGRGAWAIPLLAAGAILLFHAFTRFFLRGWYVMPFAFGLSVLAGPAWTDVAAWAGSRIRARGYAQIGMAAVVLVAFGSTGATSWRTGSYPWQATAIEAALWAQDNLAPDTVIGSFNAGIMDWYSGHPVINLDGVVSEPAYRAIRGRQILAYAREYGVDFIIDWQSSVESTYAPFFEEGYLSSLHPLRSFAASGDGAGAWRTMVVYELRD